MNEQEKRVRAGDRARILLEDTLLNDTLKTMRDFWQLEIQNSKAREVKKREECYRMLKCVEQFESTLKQTVHSGKVAKSALEALSTNVRRLIRTEY